MKKPRRTTIEGPFVPRLIEMLDSPAYKVLSRSGHRVLSRLEIELGNHGGKNNGSLPVTYGDFERYGMDPHSVAPAIREVCALGFVKVTERGRPSKSDFGRHPNKFQLTYCHGHYGEKPTHEWKRHSTLEQALKAARKARQAKDERAVARVKTKLARPPLPVSARVTVVELRPQAFKKSFAGGG